MDWRMGRRVTLRAKVIVVLLVQGRVFVWDSLHIIVNNSIVWNQCAATIKITGKLVVIWVDFGHLLDVRSSINVKSNLGWAHSCCSELWICARRHLDISTLQLKVNTVTILFLQWLIEIWLPMVVVQIVMLVLGRLLAVASVVIAAVYIGAGEAKRVVALSLLASHH